MPEPKLPEDVDAPKAMVLACGEAAALETEVADLKASNPSAGERIAPDDRPRGGVDRTGCPL